MRGVGVGVSTGPVLGAGCEVGCNVKGGVADFLEVVRDLEGDPLDLVATARM